MKQLQYHLKHFTQRVANRFGYRIERSIDDGIAPIDIFDLVLRQLTLERPDLFFVQIGAHDGRCDDPLRPYITKYHWRGILVEPQPEMFAALQANYRDEPQLIFEPAAIASFDGTMSLYRSSDSTGPDSLRASFSREVLQRQVGYHTSIQELSVPALTISSLLARHQVQRLDLMQIDAEGFDFEIIKMMVAANVLPTVIHFEHLLLSNADRQACYTLLASHGYRLGRNDINTLAYRQPKLV